MLVTVEGHTSTPDLGDLVQESSQIAPGAGARPFRPDETLDRVVGNDYRWSVLAAGRFQMPFATQAAMMGGSVRVGLEDSLYIGRGKLAGSNAEQVAKIRTILTELGHEIATPSETRRILALKGGDMVGF